MDDLLRIARQPAVTTHPDATVREACQLMTSEKVGAVVVLDGGHLMGIFSERDVVTRVVVPGLPPDTTRVGDVMTRDVSTADLSMTEDQAVALMHNGKFRHLPLVDAEGKVVGTLSVRHLLRQRVDRLDLHNRDLMGYLSTDGGGG